MSGDSTAAKEHVTPYLHTHLISPSGTIHGESTHASTALELIRPLFSCTFLMVSRNLQISNPYHRSTARAYMQNCTQSLIDRIHCKGITITSTFGSFFKCGYLDIWGGWGCTETKLHLCDKTRTRVERTEEEGERQ